MIVSKGFWQKFDRHTAAEFRVRGLIHLAHPTGPQVAGNLIVCESSSNH
jgi:hypothetical protein